MMAKACRKTSVFLGALVSALLAGCAVSPSAVKNCPQPRFTGKAPDEFYNLKSPLSPAAQDAKVGERLYFDGTTERFACATCHGKKGGGNGEMAREYDPPPRNFACAQAVSGIPDGQLFWIIRFGSPGTGMPRHKNFTEEETWQLVAYVRGLAK